MQPTQLIVINQFDLSLLCGSDYLGVVDVCAMAVSGQLELVQALQLACSQNPDELKVGERKLEGWKTQACYYSGLSVSTVIFKERSNTAEKGTILTCYFVVCCVVRLCLETRVWSQL